MLMKQMKMYFLRKYIIQARESQIFVQFWVKTPNFRVFS